MQKIKYTDIVKEQAHRFKLDILEQFCETIHQTLVDRKSVV